MIQQKIKDDIAKVAASLQSSGEWPQFDMPEIRIETPAQPEHGDFSSNIAMLLSRVLKTGPINIANELKVHLESEYEKIEAVHPGFLNFFVKADLLAGEAANMIAEDDAFGSSTLGNGEKVLFEFISANPTGPLTLPNGRGGFLGDVLSNVYEELGYDVVREYYINDRGHQIDVLGESVARRYLQQQGINVPFDEELYQGGYIEDLAKQLDLKDYKLTNGKKLEWVKDQIKKKALKMMLQEIQRVVKEKMRIQFDSWFSEKKMYDDELPAQMLKVLREKDAVYEQDGATFVRTTQFGDDKDRVIIKSSGEGAYYQGDVSLFYDRAFRQHVNKIVLILGADHHGYEKRLKAIPNVLGSDVAFDILFVQMATLVKAGEEVRMSKRKGTFVTIEELIDEVGPDVARFFFLMYSADRHMTFDLDLAKERSEKNPVFYVQYAYARLCSMLAEVNKLGVPKQPALELIHEAEKALVKKLIQFPELLVRIHETYEAHQLATYALELARAFHQFYAHCRVIENGAVNESRYALVIATKNVLGKTLRLLGVTAPEHM